MASIQPNELTNPERELLAGLKTDVAYQLLLTKIEAWIDYLTDSLSRYNCPDTEKILPYWRALKIIHLELKTTPEQIADELEMAQKALNEQVMELSQSKRLINEELYKKQTNNLKYN